MNPLRQPLSCCSIQLYGRTAAPFPPASLSGEGLEGRVAAVSSDVADRWHTAGCIGKTLPATSLRQRPLRFDKLEI